jgi:hypothetical protein
MARDDGPGGSLTGPSGSSEDWATQLTAKVDEVVSVIRDKTVLPVSRIVRYLILALLALGVALLLAVLFSVGIIRVLDTELFHKRVWASYLVVGGIFSLAGLLLSSKRQRRS